MKVGARVMVATNVDVSDGLTNVVMESVAHVVKDKRTGYITTISVGFDNENAGQEAKCTSIYKHINENVFQFKKHRQHFLSMGQQGQFSLVLAWAVTFHKCQGLTLPEIVVDITPSKGQFKAGESYIAFSRV